MSSEEAWAKAAHCAARAGEAGDEQSRFLFTKLRDSWIRIANNTEFFDIAESNKPNLPLDGA